MWFGGSGVYHSTDGAASFGWLPNASGAGGLNVLVADPSDGQRLFAGTDSNGVVRSDDGGATWQPTGAGVVGQVRGLAADPYHPGVLFAAAGNDLYRSDDDGDTWQPSDSGMSGVENAVAADPDSAGTCMPYGGAVVYRSTDDGLRSEPVRVDRVDLRPQRSCCRPDRRLDDYPVVLYGIFRSTDGCSDWTTISPNNADALSVGPDGTAYAASGAGAIAFAAGSTTGIESSKANGYDLPLSTYAIAADSSRPGVGFAGTEQGTYETVDGGGRWAKLTTNGLTSTWSLSLLVPRHRTTATTRGWQRFS